MLIQVVSSTLIKLALLFLVGGILVLGLQFQTPIKTSPETSYRSQTMSATLHCDSSGVCDLVISK